jgi:hypothetical protein
MTQRNLGNVQLGKMCSDTCVAESPKPVAKPFESVADYGSATLYILMAHIAKLRKSVGGIPQASAICSKLNRLVERNFDIQRHRGTLKSRTLTGGVV